MLKYIQLRDMKNKYGFLNNSFLNLAGERGREPLSPHSTGVLERFVCSDQLEQLVKHSSFCPFKGGSRRPNPRSVSSPSLSGVILTSTLCVFLFSTPF